MLSVNTTITKWYGQLPPQGNPTITNCRALPNAYQHPYNNKQAYICAGGIFPLAKTEFGFSLPRVKQQRGKKIIVKIKKIHPAQWPLLNFNNVFKMLLKGILCYYKSDFLTLVQTL